MTKKRLFNSAKALELLIAQYFKHTDNAIAAAERAAKKTPARKIRRSKKNAPLYEPGFPTFNSLFHYLGFDSEQEFEEYEAKPRFSRPLKRAKLQVMAIYENKLHTHSYGGATYALRSIGWSEKANSNIAAETVDNSSTPKVAIIHVGVEPASSERDVVL
ncbi:MAG: hypothetical protein ACHQHN_16800 [Sphingobacteriales bacterium]